MTQHADLAAAIDALLPQTQCTRCGYPDCRSYAQAIAHGEAEINQCPPGGAEGIARLAQCTGRPALPLNPGHGSEGPVRLAVIDEAWCIGCTLCIAACPMDCIAGAARRMHTVIEAQCTGCELCVPACPVDCISLVDSTPGRTGWAAWSATQAQAARERYAARTARAAMRERTLRPAQESAGDEEDDMIVVTERGARRADAPLPQADEARKRSFVEAALARARALRKS